MAKKPQLKSAPPADTAASPALATVILPEGLVDLMVAAAEAAKTLVRASAESVAKPDDADLQAAATGAGEVLTKALASIEDWFKEYLAARLAAADSEADRQLEEKRAALKALLEEHDAKVQDLATRRAQVDADLDALKNTPPATVENGGDGDLAIPAALSIELPEGMELITVIGPAAGLRRAGHLFNAIPNSIVVTAEQKALIAADPALSITDDPSAEAEHAARQGEKPAVSAFIFDPHGFTDVKVLGPKAGRRRIGHSFGPEASVVRVDRDELAELLADTLLAVGQA